MIEEYIKLHFDFNDMLDFADLQACGCKYPHATLNKSGYTSDNSYKAHLRYIEQRAKNASNLRNNRNNDNDLLAMIAAGIVKGGFNALDFALRGTMDRAVKRAIEKVFEGQGVTVKH